MSETKTEKSRRLSRKWKTEGRCAHCGGERDNPAFVICGKCRERSRRLRTDLIVARVDRGLCPRCGKPVEEKGFRECAACSKRQYKYQSDRPENRRKKYKAIKEEVFAAYGGYVCACCGETEPLFLCIDHIHEDGADHRRTISGRGTSMYQWLKSNGFPPGFQVLCQNCNFGKHLNGGVCPHLAARSAASACGDAGSGPRRKPRAKPASTKQEPGSEVSHA